LDATKEKRTKSEGANIYLARVCSRYVKEKGRRPHRRKGEQSEHSRALNPPCRLAWKKGGGTSNLVVGEMAS